MDHITEGNPDAPPGTQAGALVLRKYQEDAVAQVRASFATGRRAVLLVLPTGAGKTVVFSYIAASSVRLGRRVLIIAHRRELIRQASAKLTIAGVEHGVIAPGFPETGHPVRVASIQTLARRMDRLQSCDLLVIDEAHHSVARQYETLIRTMPKARILGVTATPQRLDGKGLGTEDGGPFDEIVIGATVGELIAQGALCRSRVYAPSVPDLRGVRTQMGDYAAADVDRVMSIPSVTGDAVEHYLKHAHGKPAIAFCVSVKHSESVAEALRSAGISARCVHGAMRVDERDAALAGLASGDVRVITTCDLIGEGLDVPSVGAVILLRPTKSVALHLQQIGRGLRPAPEKEHLVILDHAGNCLRSGFAEDPRAWSLKGRGGQPAETLPEPSKCPECGALHRTARSCPGCGHGYPLPETNAREVQEISGELLEVTEAARLTRIKQWPLRALLTGHETQTELEEIRLARGYKKGWVWHTLQSQRAMMPGEAAR